MKNLINLKKIFNFKKIVKFILVIIILLLVLEIVSKTIVYFSHGHLKKPSDIVRGDNLNSYVQVLEKQTKCTYRDSLFPHPYLGWVHWNNPKCLKKIVFNSDGFYGPEFRTHCLLTPSYFRTLSNRFYDQFVEREFGDVFDECGFDKERALLPSSDERYLSIRSQMPNPLPDRKIIDKIGFDALEFNDSQRNEVYWSLCESVLTRLKKADSV